jgi:hypothetical protein
VLSECIVAANDIFRRLYRHILQRVEPYYETIARYANIPETFLGNGSANTGCYYVVRAVEVKEDNWGDQVTSVQESPSKRVNTISININLSD